jgi:ribonucleotide monophosphatase NagD (HAD superfamily)
VVGNSPNVIRALLEPCQTRKVNIPFALMTNGGGVIESDKARDINERIGLTGTGIELSGDHMILCHTPLKDPELLARFSDKHVIVTGKYEELAVALEYGYAKAIHVLELATFFADQIPNDISE